MIVDEIHAVAGDKRGAHLALSLERLDALAGRRLQRIGLSATQKPIEEVARLLVGAGRLAAGRRTAIARSSTPATGAISTSRSRRPTSSSGRSPRHELRAAIYDRIVALVASHRTTIVFVNTRRLVERVAHELTRAARRRQGRRASRQPLARDPPGGRRRAQVGRGVRWSSRPRRSSSASTSATSISSATSARRARSRRCCSASAAPGTCSAPCRRASCFRSRATSSCSPPPRCAPCARASSTG